MHSLLVTACLTLLAQSPDTSTTLRGPLGARVDSLLQADAAKGYAGIALIAKDGAVILRKGYGLADRAKGIRMSPATVVQIGSVTKQFTAAAILVLADRGKLSLDDSLTRFFPAAPADKRAITLRQLLRHQSGLDDLTGDDFETVARDEMIRRALALPMLFPPGTGTRYSNAAFQLLAAIVEQVSGTSFERFVQQNIFVPAGLRETGLVTPHWAPGRLAHEYTGSEDRKTMLDRAHATDGSWWNLRGAGGFLSTVDEMREFYRVLLTTDRLFKPQTRALMFNPQSPSFAAGSDGVAEFVYNREPAAGYEILLASTNDNFRIDQLLDPVRTALGLPKPGGVRIQAGGPVVMTQPGAALPPQAGPFVMPDTPAGRVAAGYFAAYAAGPDSLKAFIPVWFAPDPDAPMANRVARHLQVRQQLGALKPLKVLEDTPTRLKILVEAGDGGNATMIFNVEAAAPFRITGVGVLR